MADDVLLKFDFVSRYPHKAWISDWSSDEHYSGGYCYKVMSCRLEPSQSIKLLVILQQRNGDKEVLASLEVSAAAFDEVVSGIVNGLVKQYDLDFQEQDFSTCRTLDEFKIASQQFGWTWSM